MAEMFRKMPSEILYLNDEYVAFCFNEACFYIKVQIDKGETPVFKYNDEGKENRHYTSFSQMYDSILND